MNLDDGGVSGGTEPCQSLCGASQYEMTCRSVGVVCAIPNPASSLGCKGHPDPDAAHRALLLLSVRGVSAGARGRFSAGSPVPASVGGGL